MRCVFFQGDSGPLGFPGLAGTAGEEVCDCLVSICICPRFWVKQHAHLCIIIFQQGEDGLPGQKGPPGSQGPFVSNSG